MPSFTSTVANLQGAGPVVEVQVAVGRAVQALLAKNNQPIPPPVPVLAMIDTGASVSVVRQGLTGQLGLQPVGMAYINTPSSTNVACYRYLVRFVFPNNVLVEVPVAEASLQGQNIQCLIGRDVLAHGVLVYIGHSNLFSLSF